MSDEKAMLFADYSKRDYELVDYQFYTFPFLEGVGFRGPKVADEDLATGRYFTVIGAAQTVGVYVQNPYPALLADRLNLPALNLGLGGINPGFFADQPELVALANRGRFVVLQVMTARSEPNERLAPVGISLVRDSKTGVVDIPEATWQRVLEDDRENLPRYISQNLESWHRAYDRLLMQLKVPVILFYFSHKPRDEKVNYQAQSWTELYGTFPQFVAQTDVEQVAGRCTGYAECRSQRNFGHRLVSRFSGEPVSVNFADLHPSATEVHTHNFYYPSQEMHEDACAAVLETVRTLKLA